MTEKYYYYRCRTTSKTGRRIYAFHGRLLHAERSADDFAARCGATSFIQQSNTMAGGIDYFEFEKKPDAIIWRKALTSKDGIDEYELNCDICQDFRISRSPFCKIPEDKWNVSYMRKQMTWKEVYLLLPMMKWRECAIREGVAGSDISDEELKSTLETCYFVPFLHFDVPKDNGRYRQKNRRAVYLEKERLRLPVVTQEELFSILELNMSHGVSSCPPPATSGKPALEVVEEKRKSIEGGKKEEPPRRIVMETPLYFFCEDWVYVRTDMPSDSEDFQPIDRATFVDLRRYALDFCK